MGHAILVQLAASGAAVAVMVALAAWVTTARPSPPLNEVRARSLLAETFPGRKLEHLWVSVDGRGALAKSGAAALVLCEHEGGIAARQLPWAMALAQSFRSGRISLDLRDVAAPRTEIALPSWPPSDLAA